MTPGPEFSILAAKPGSRRRDGLTGFFGGASFDLSAQSDRIMTAASTTITRADLAEAVYNELGLSRNDCARYVEMVLGEVIGALERGEPVKLSSFGSFSVRQKGKRVGRNPKTGEEVPILPRKVLVFRASHVLKNKINKALGKSAAKGAAQAQAADGS